MVFALGGIIAVYVQLLPSILLSEWSPSILPRSRDADSQSPQRNFPSLIPTNASSYEQCSKNNCYDNKNNSDSENK